MTVKVLYTCKNYKVEKMLSSTDSNKSYRLVNKETNKIVLSGDLKSITESVTSIVGDAEKIISRRRHGNEKALEHS